MNAVGEVIETTRRARGMTQEQLSAAIGVSQAALSRYEGGMREPDHDTLVHLAHALRVTVRFLEHAGRVRGAMAVDAHMRRRRTAPPRQWQQLEAQLNVFRMHISLLFEEVSLMAEQHVPTFDPVVTSPSTAARLLRMQWRMPVGPVRNLTRWLEASGCVVIESPFGTARVDGLSQWVGEHPVLFINSEAPTDRKRLTLAHELGHLVLHSSEMIEEAEEQADAFAAEFLMPLEVIKSQLRDVRIGRLPDLKREWGVSMQALIERAFRAGLLSAGARTSMYKQFSYRGWRINEPISDELPPEVPQMPAMIGGSLRAKGLSPNEVAHMAGFADQAANTVFLEQEVGPRLRAL